MQKDRRRRALIAAVAHEVGEAVGLDAVGCVAQVSLSALTQIKS